MILDAVLLMVGRMARDEHPCLEVAIFPEIRFAGNEAIASTFRQQKILWTGIIQYKDEMQNKGEPSYWTDENINTASMFLSERLLGVGGIRYERDIFTLAQRYLLLVEAKHVEEEEGGSLGSHIREAVGQAVGLAVRTKSVSIYHFSLHSFVLTRS